MRVALVSLLLLGIAFADPSVYFQERFETKEWRERWIDSKHKSDYGTFDWTAGKFYGDAEKDKGVQTSENAKFYAMSAGFDKFTNEGKTVVIQFTVKHEQKIDCGGGYVKIFPSTMDQKDMHGESNYNIMFGPDICGPGTKKVHVIFNYKGKNLLIKNDIRCKDDEFTHLYTLIVRSDNSYMVKIDNKKEKEGTLEEDWDFLPTKTIPDPEAKKPEDWDDRAKIDDPEDSKPEDWVETEYVSDPDAEKPEDWDDDMDGEWEPPMIPNPEYKGEWSPKLIDNPDFQGMWVHPEVPNPEYEADDNLYLYEDFGSIGIDIWQVKSGTIFDNFLITDDETYAEEVGNETWGETKDPEKKMKEAQDEEERKAAEEAAKAMEEETEAETDDNDDDDDEDNNDEDLLSDGDDDTQEEEDDESVGKDEL
ncbi:calreticulin-like [Halichondria panicea]|uniref:calreticulin-like n=1 Tax=Halichondria panicea TaxID=6063 RepID=UPI00312B60A7